MKKYQTIVADPPWDPSISKILGAKWTHINKASPHKHFHYLLVSQVYQVLTLYSALVQT